LTDEKQALFELIEKQTDTNSVRELLAFAERLMNIEGRPWRAYAREDQSPQRLPRSSLGTRAGGSDWTTGSDTRMLGCSSVRA